MSALGRHNLPTASLHCPSVQELFPATSQQVEPPSLLQYFTIQIEADYCLQPSGDQEIPGLDVQRFQSLQISQHITLGGLVSGPSLRSVLQPYWVGWRWQSHTWCGWRGRMVSVPCWLRWWGMWKERIDGRRSWRLTPALPGSSAVPVKH